MHMHTMEESRIAFLLTASLAVSSNFTQVRAHNRCLFSLLETIQSWHVPKDTVDTVERSLWVNKPLSMDQIDQMTSAATQAFVKSQCFAERGDNVCPTRLVS